MSLLFCFWGFLSENGIALKERIDFEWDSDRQIGGGWPGGTSVEDRQTEEDINNPDGIYLRTYVTALLGLGAYLQYDQR